MKEPHVIKRNHAATLGRETLAILAAGCYTSPSGRRVEIAEALRRACAGTRTYPPEAKLPIPAFPNRPTHFEVVNVSTLAAARRLVSEGQRVAALNFASAKHPGGGFLGGARAQEESLARASGLYATLVNNPMYTFHRGRHDPMYTTWVIHSPDVPVFRADEGELLEEPYACSFLTSPAVNAGALRNREHRHAEVLAAMAERVQRVLTVAALHGHETLVLGAWGCGVFRNDPEEIARLSREALSGPFRGAFTRVVFAILDTSEEKYFSGPFERAFAGKSETSST